MVLSEIYDKRYVIHNGCHSIAFGHERLKPLVAFNESAKSYDDLLSDEHLDRLLALEKKMIDDWPALKKRIEHYEKFEKPALDYFSQWEKIVFFFFLDFFFCIY